MYPGVVMCVVVVVIIGVVVATCRSTSGDVGVRRVKAPDGGEATTPRIDRGAEEANAVSEAAREAPLG